MEATNKSLQAAGIIWHPCTLCKVTWPFPQGLVMDMREWVCCICSYAAWAKFQRYERDKQPNNRLRTIVT